ncbi:MAG: signal peptidase I [Bacteriovoracaceae bacterium]|nr:signal peptidase I [Bacteriovoracaceae bacterium]
MFIAFCPLAQFGGIRLTLFLVVLPAIIFVHIHTFIILYKNKKMVEKKSFDRWYVYNLILILFVVVWVTLPKQTAFFRLPSGAMEPTLRIGDWIMSDPIKSVKRGDIVIFNYPVDPNITYIKRVAAIPGDTIEIINKVIHINNTPIEQDELELKDIDYFVSQKFIKNNVKVFKTNSGKKQHRILKLSDNLFLANMSKTTIPKDQYFVLGDNRDFSSDSRIWGFVPKENIFATPTYIYFRLDYFGRIGTKIE